MLPDPADLRAIDEAAALFFAAFDNRGGRRPDMSGLRALLLPDARIFKLDGEGVQSMDVDGFIAPREALLAGGALAGFHEWETQARTTLFGGAAVRRCAYRKQGVSQGAPIEGAGFKAISFVKEGGRWRIASVVWQDEREGLSAEALEL
jgi:hypothetical protein